MERWIRCSDFPAYEVSSMGNVRRISVVRGKEPVILRPWKNSMGYDVVHLRKEGKTIKQMVHRLVAKEFYNLSEGLEVDHRYHNLEDYTQLRIVTRAQNARNARGKRNRTSHFKGVSWSKDKRLWYACIAIDGISKSLGRYRDEKRAALAYDRAALAAWGEYAFLNFPDKIDQHALSL